MDRLIALPWGGAGSCFRDILVLSEISEFDLFIALKPGAEWSQDQRRFGETACSQIFSKCGRGPLSGAATADCQRERHGGRSASPPAAAPPPRRKGKAEERISEEGFSVKYVQAANSACDAFERAAGGITAARGRHYRGGSKMETLRSQFAKFACFWSPCKHNFDPQLNLGTLPLTLRLPRSQSLRVRPCFYRARERLCGCLGGRVRKREREQPNIYNWFVKSGGVKNLLARSEPL